MLTLHEFGWDALDRYASVPSRLDVTSILSIEPIEGGLGGVRLVEERIEPWVKDYDAVNPPSTWRAQAPDARWQLLVATNDSEVVGTAATFADGGPVATLWDVRVRPEAQRDGVGRALVDASTEWARRDGARWLRAETQNVNVPACRFYRRLGARLGGVDAFLYAGTEAAGEVALLWYIDLGHPEPRR